jgi:DNA-binding SARP family transcriptional activator/tetratricopeptide (TPR) repeat protein/energy-coupling factor transporter ATP-binding protein EcfA2
MVGIRLIGRFAVMRDGVEVDRAELGSRKGRELLKLLAVERRRTVSVDRIVEVIWPHAPPVNPAGSVATLVSRLRRAVGLEVIDGDRDGYRMGQPPDVRVDLDDAFQWVAEGERRLAAGEPSLGMAAATRAEELLSADTVLADEPEAEWAEPARVELEDLRTRSRHLLAEAALATGEHQIATRTASVAVAADPFDERSRRALMRAHLAAGEPSRALATYAEFKELLAAELGADPAAETQRLHLAALREEQPTVGPVRVSATLPRSNTLGLVGRAEPLRQLRAAWNSAAGGTSGLVLVTGEAGIGKTTLVDELAGIATTTGGTVLSARCYAAERSLFLQPIVEALVTIVRVTSPARLNELAGDHAPVLARLLSDTGGVLGPSTTRRDNADLERRRAFEAITALVRGLADLTPLLVVLDDVQNAGRSTVELLHYLARHTPNSRVLVVGTVRAEEGAEIIEAVSGVATLIELGPLGRDAVSSLASAAGRPDQADAIMKRTRGHTLFVVETLRALVADSEGIPESLEAAVITRVRRAGVEVEELLRAAAVLGVAFEPSTVAGLLDWPIRQVLGACTDALAARLVVVAGRDYEFANDLVRDVLFATTLEPTRHSYHLLAADLLTARPEAVALHASAAADWPRAARAWLVAGEQALSRAATADAVELLSHALVAAERIDDLDVQARALLTRARARAARTDYFDAYSDIERATQTAHEAGDRRLEAMGLRELGGEVPTALGHPIAECLAQLERGLVLAESMSDRAMEADLRAWMAVLAANALQFTDSVEHGRLAVVAARASGDDEALAKALDGQKTSLAYLGEVEPLIGVLAELEPLLRRLGDLFRLHWAVFESAFPAAAAGDWATAAARIESAIEINRRSGFSAYAAWHLAHLGWLARLTGQYDEAIELGRRALAHSNSAQHIWCAVAAGAQLGTTLLEVGDVGAAVEVLQIARAAAESGAEAYLLRVLCPLAEATGSIEILLEADDLLGRISTPPGSAFLLGDGCYLAVARSWLSRDDAQRARDVLAPLIAAATRVPWVGALAAASLVDGQAALRLGQIAEAELLLGRAAELAVRHGLPRVASEAAELLDHRGLGRGF